MTFPSSAPSVASPIQNSSNLTPVYDLPSVAFFGRSLAEYCEFFDLEPSTLSHTAVLDVAAGPSSFVAEACRSGVDAVALDPLYGNRPETLRAHVELDYAHMFKRMRKRGQRTRFVFKSFRSIAHAERDRRAAAARFLTDYQAHFAHGRYFGAALPKLPFLDASFDLVLCAHLLFIYPAQFDFEFHVAACRELMRVARTEVRIHPVCGPDGQPYPQLPALLAALQGCGIAAAVRAVDYEFFAGANSMLVLRR